MSQTHSITIVELEWRQLQRDVASILQLPSEEIAHLISGAFNQIQSRLALDSSPLQRSTGGLRVVDLAGLVFIAPNLALEIAPKFLGDTGSWREDFYFIAEASLHGRILSGNGVSGASDEQSTLTNLLGRSLADMYMANHRRPLKVYRKTKVREFALDGEFDAESLREVDETGFEQYITEFSRANQHTALIRSAAAKLLPMTRSLEVKARLERVVDLIPPSQVYPTSRQSRLPSRARHWQPVIDLSQDVLGGFGGTYETGAYSVPTFVLKMWKAWEDLLAIAIRAAVYPRPVELQSEQILGSRIRENVVKTIKTTPDAIVTIGAGAHERRLLVDAKYKGRFGQSSFSISSADVYESMAFAKATGINEVVLLYPAPAGGVGTGPPNVGAFQQFEKITVDDLTISGIQLGVAGISKKGAFTDFSQAIKQALAAA